ncbi:MAG: hypothetical protein M1132_12995 [Chloroflexi bacterium]|nr:hypothetical protein [Chloroflexota bacterium]
MHFFEERRREKEIERDLQARRGKIQVQRHMNKQREMAKKLWQLGKRATALGETRQFQQIGKQYLWTLEDIKRWERYLLAYEAIEARRDQAKSVAEFMTSVQAMSKSMTAHANPAEFAKTQRQLELALARAQNLEQTMDYLMEATDETVFSSDELSDSDLETSLKEMEKTMKQEAESGSSDTEVDSRIAEGLKKIEEEMKKK